MCIQVFVWIPVFISLGKKYSGVCRIAGLYNNFYDELFEEMPNCFPKWLDPGFLICCVFFGCSVLECRILVPWPGIKPTPLVLEVWSFNHWTAREIPVLFLCLGLWSILSWLFYMYNLGVKVILPQPPSCGHLVSAVVLKRPFFPHWNVLTLLKISWTYMCVLIFVFIEYMSEHFNIYVILSLSSV